MGSSLTGKLGNGGGHSIEPLELRIYQVNMEGRKTNSRKSRKKENSTVPVPELGLGKL